jgi:thiamine biosynthesis lipoprotein
MYRATFNHIKNNLLLKPPGILVLFVAGLLSACNQPVRQYDYSIFAFGTLIDITLYDVTKKQAADAFEQLQQDFDHYHQNWSPWTNGDLAQLNEKLSNSIATQVPTHLVPLIRTSMELSRQSQHYYNPTIGQLINLWQFHKYQEDNIQPPDDKTIQTLVKNNPRLTDLQINEQNQLISRNPAASLNFGAFAKGYAIELGIKRLQKLNIDNAIINAGGDLSVIGQHGERAWNIGIRHPREDSILGSVEVKNNESVFTSGDYERFYFYQGKRYHHILDPTTGYPTDDAQSVTVIHQDAGRADAAATALFVAGSKKWQSIAKNMGIHLVMLIDANGDIHLTRGMQERVKFLNKSPTSHIILSEEL